MLTRCQVSLPAVPGQCVGSTKQNQSHIAAGLFFFSSRRRHTRCRYVTGVQTCALPLAGTDCRPLPLRRRASRPQLKRDPLGSATAMNLIRPILPLLVASVVACHTQTLSANEKDVLIVALGELQGDSI